MPPIARGHTWLSQPLPVSTVPNTGRNQSDSGYRGLDEEETVSITNLSGIQRLSFGVSKSLGPMVNVEVFCVVLTLTITRV